MDKTMTDEQKMNARGLEFIRPIFGPNGMGGTFQEQPQQYDYGTDFEVQLFENSKYVGWIIRGQLKSGESHLDSESQEYFRHHIPGSDASAWSKSNTPFFYVWYSPDRNQAFWLNIRKYLRQNYNGEKSFAIEIPKRNVLCKESLDGFLEAARNELAGMPYTEPRLYKPLYDFLYGDFNKKEEDDLRQILKSYENTMNSLRASDYARYFRETLNFGLAHRRLYSLSIAIMNLEHLGFERNETVPDNLKFERHYLLAVMNYENNSYGDAIHYLETIPAQLLDKRHLLLRSLIDDQAGRVGNAQIGYKQFVDSCSEKDKYLKGLVCLLGGVLSRRNEDYEDAEKWFNMAESCLEHDKFYNAVVKANFGALRFIEEKRGQSIDQYRTAAHLFHDVGERDAEAEILQNLSHVLFEKSAIDKGDSSADSGFDTLRKSAYLKSKSDYLLSKDFVLNGYENYANEGFEATAKSYTFRSSNKIFDGNREFGLAERISESLGSFVSSKWARGQNGKCKFYLGQMTGDMNLLLDALYTFIQEDNEDGIGGVYEKAGSFYKEADILEVLKWLFTIKGDRFAELGRLKFLKFFADLIPDGYIDQTIELCLLYVKPGNSFASDHNYGRNAVTAIGRLSARLTKDQLKRVIAQVMDGIAQKDWFVVDAILEMLLVVPFHRLEDSDLTMIVDILSADILDKIRTRDPWMVYGIWTRIADAAGRKLRKSIYHELSKRYWVAHASGKKPKEVDVTKDIDPHVALDLMMSCFDELRTRQQVKLLVDYACHAMDVELRKNSLKEIYSYGSGGARIARYLVRLADKESLNRLIGHLLDYIASDNLVPKKRSEGIYSLLGLDLQRVSIKQQKRVQTEMLAILDNKISSEDEDHLSVPEEFDVAKLRALALVCLSTFGYSADYIIPRARSMVYSAPKDSLTFVVSSLGRLLRRRISREERSLITGMLLQWLAHDDVKVVSSSLELLTKSVHDIRHHDHSVFTSAITALSENGMYEKRCLAAKACVELLRRRSRSTSLWKDILNKLRNDVHFQVRNDAAGIVGRG